MRVTQGHFSILGLLTGAFSVAIGAVAVGLAAGSWSHTLSEAVVLLCIVSPIFGLAFAWACPIHHDQDPDD